MQFNIRNIGLVKSANIKVDGLTVIAGHNNIGKSYIGKAIYSLFASKKFIYENSINNQKVHDLKKEAASLEKTIRGKTNISEDLMFYHPQIIRHPKETISNIRTDIDLVLYRIFEKFPDLKEDKDIQEHILRINSFPANLSVENHNYLIDSIFRKEYNNKNNSTFPASINCDDSIHIEVNDNKTTAYLDSEYYECDVILIDTPLILNQLSYIRDNLAFNNKSAKLLPYHTIDLVQKLIEGGYETPTENPYYDRIKKIMAGNILLNNDQVVYQDNYGYSYNISNVASGAKSFGIIQLLLAGGSINPNTILIIDEPEVHLHPEWQLRYAELLVELVKNDISILVASHSPYFVEALKVYSDQASITDKTNFYLGEMEEDKTGSIFEDVTNNLDKIFDKFASPMIRLSIQK